MSSIDSRVRVYISIFVKICKSIGKFFNGFAHLDVRKIMLPSNVSAWEELVTCAFGLVSMSHPIFLEVRSQKKPPLLTPHRSKQ